MPKPRQPLQIAIDGPVGAGKSDISARLAKDLRLTYLYTGAMYRALALLCLRDSVPFKDEARVVAVLDANTIDLVPPDPDSIRSVKVLVNGKDVTEELFSPVVDQATSDVSTLSAVRKRMVERQQELARGKSVVMEGRDIGLRVLPQAQLKVFLTASPTERAKRRLLQWQEKGVIGKTLDDALAETKKRDMQDMNRAVDPLQKLPDAWELDTTGMTQDDVVAAIRKELETRQLV